MREYATKTWTICIKFHTRAKGYKNLSCSWFIEASTLKWWKMTMRSLVAQLSSMIYWSYSKIFVRILIWFLVSVCYKTALVIRIRRKYFFENWTNILSSEVEALKSSREYLIRRIKDEVNCIKYDDSYSNYQNI